MGQSRFVTPAAWNTSNSPNITNSIVEAAVFATKIVSGDINQEGRSYLLKAWGKYSTAGTPTLILGLRWGAAVSGVMLCQSDPIVTASGVTNALWEVEMLFTVRTVGSTGTILATQRTTIGSGVAPSVGVAAGNAAVCVSGSAGGAAPVAVTVDLTADTSLTLVAQWGAASVSNILSGLELSLLQVN